MFISCSTSSNSILVNENYQWQQNTKKDLIIFPIQYDSLSILNWDDVVDDFEVDSANYKSFIYDTLSKSVLINSKSCTRYINIVDGKKLFDWDSIRNDKKNYLQINQKIDKNYIATFYIPKKELLTEDHLNSYALIIKRITIARNVERLPGTMTYSPGQIVNTPGGSFQTPGHWSSGWTPENLGAKIEFIIWDYEKDEFVKCGIVISKEDLLGGMTTSSWLDLFKTIPLDLYDETPFGISPVNYYYKK